MWPTSKAHFLPNGRRAADWWKFFRQPDLAHTLRSMVEVEKKASGRGRCPAKAAIDKVRDYFYRGDIAHKIDAFSKANGGLLRYEDLAAFKVQPEEPVSTTPSKAISVYKEWLLEPGPGDDRSHQHFGRLR